MTQKDAAFKIIKRQEKNAGNQRCFPSSPNPISPIPITPNFSSHFTLCLLAPTHFALYHLAPLPPRPILFSPTYHFALWPIPPLPIRLMPSCPFLISPFATSPNAVLPIYHLAPLSFHHSVSVSLNLLTTAHDSLVLELKQLPDTESEFKESLSTLSWKN